MKARRGTRTDTKFLTHPRNPPGQLTFRNTSEIWTTIAPRWPTRRTTASSPTLSLWCLTIRGGGWSPAWPASTPSRRRRRSSSSTAMTWTFVQTGISLPGNRVRCWELMFYSKKSQNPRFQEIIRCQTRWRESMTWIRPGPPRLRRIWRIPANASYHYHLLEFHK